MEFHEFGAFHIFIHLEECFSGSKGWNASFVSQVIVGYFLCVEHGEYLCEKWMAFIIFILKIKQILNIIDVWMNCHMLGNVYTILSL